MSAWYAIDSVLCADALKGLFHINWPVPLFAACLSMLMAVNNFFGFQGVANFARYFAAPLLVLWVGYTFCKVVPTVPLDVLTASSVSGHAPVSFMSALTLVSSFVIGFAVWGNEPDYWRYSKPNKKFVVYSLIAALLVGEVIFPATGWMVARLSGITDYITATNYMNVYSFGGVALFAALVLIANYCAANDSNMYGMINALENLKRLPHKVAVIILAGASSAFAAWLAQAGSSRSLESIASLNCVIIPVMTVIMIIEEFVIKPRFNLPDNRSVVVPMNELPAIRWPAFIASHLGLLVGICTAGVIPGLESLFVGVCSVQSWLVAAVAYYVMRVVEIKNDGAAVGS
jgi:purine-cytosine permease-like protein